MSSVILGASEGDRVGDGRRGRGGGKEGRKRERMKRNRAGGVSNIGASQLLKLNGGEKRAVMNSDEQVPPGL